LSAFQHVRKALQNEVRPMQDVIAKRRKHA
jgi:hypothetical protein